MKIEVKGMMCHGCEKRAVDALMKLGLTNVTANHELGIVTFDESNIDINKIKETICDLGFEIK